MDNRYYTKNRRKYNLKVHIVLVTKYRKKILADGIDHFVKKACLDLSEKYRWNIIAMETDQDHIHIMLEYDAGERICDIISILKQQTTYLLWKQFPDFLLRHYWKKHIFWSDGYFACSIGEVSSETVKKYIESQG